MKNAQEDQASGVHLVTGAFGYSGSYIAQELLAKGLTVRTLTGRSPDGHDLEGRVQVRPLDFEKPDQLRRSMEGVSVVYNTYWVRFSEAGFCQADAVGNTKLLFACAKAAGVQRIVHVSITRPSLASPYQYFRCKAEMERALVETGLGYSILRPAVLFGGDDILVNNMAWSLRHLPMFGVFGDGRYRMQPIHVEDFARLAVWAGQESGQSVVQAVGAEVWEYGALVRGLARAMGIWRPVVGVPTWLGLLGAKLIGKLVGDVVLTREEVGALMDDLLIGEGDCERPELLKIGLRGWMEAQADQLGRRYGNELGRRRGLNRG